MANSAVRLLQIFGGGSVEKKVSGQFYNIYMPAYTFSVFSAVMLREYSIQRFLLAIIPAVICSGILITELFIAHKNSLRFIASLNESVGVTENEVLYYAESPAVIMNEDFLVLWCNKEFDSQIMPDYEIFGNNIGKFFDIDLKELMIEGVTTNEYNGRTYKITSIVIDKNNRKMIYLNFTDISEFAELFSKYKRTRPSVILLVIDNYEDVLQNFKESEKAAGCGGY